VGQLAHDLSLGLLQLRLILGFLPSGRHALGLTRPLLNNEDQICLAVSGLHCDAEASATDSWAFRDSGLLAESFAAGFRNVSA